MKVFNIAVKDLLRSFRSSFLLGMMFVVPLLLTGLIYFAFGNMTSGQGTFAIPTTHALVVNLDQPAPQSGFDAGKMLVEFLRNEALAPFLQVTITPSETEARAAVDRREVDMAIIVPMNLTAAVEQPDTRAAVTLYHEPTLTIAPTIVKMLVGDFLDGFSGAKIAVEVTNRQMSERGLTHDQAAAEAVAQRYAAWIQSVGHSREGEATDSVIITRMSQEDTRPTSPITVFLGPVMAGMMIFFVFFTGSAAAQSILYEDEEGTLARLFTTPTSHATILGGKFVAVFATLIVQVTVLLIASSLLFGIHWGEPLTIALVMVGLVVAASGFGVFLISLIKTTRQAGPVSAAVIVVTGILGGLVPTGDPSQPSPFDTLGLALPQGWALRGWKLSLSGASAGEVLLPFIVLIATGAMCFIIGTLVFRHRFE